jgi:uncharacterized protein YaeQ
MIPKDAKIEVIHWPEIGKPKPRMKFHERKAERVALESRTAESCKEWSQEEIARLDAVLSIYYPAE